MAIGSAIGRTLALAGGVGLAFGGSLALGVASARAQGITGVGYAEITADGAAVKEAAEADALRGLVRALLEDAIGAERAAQVPAETVQSLADQIQPTMILNQSGRRAGDRYQVSLQANVDPAWFTTQMRIRGIQTSAQNAGASRRLIFIMLDQNNGVGRDYSKPQEVITEFSSSKGASYSDTSVNAYSDRARAGTSYNAKSGSSARSSAAAGYSDGYSSAAARRSSRASSASSVRSSSAYSRNTSAVQKNDVQAEVHDNVHYRQEIRMQKAEAKSVPSDYALSAMSRELVSFGVEFADAGPALNAYFGKRPLWSALRTDPRLAAFQSSLASRQGAFFMGGSLTVQDTGSDGMFTCTGTLDARVAATSNGHVIASGSANGTASDIDSAERCEAKLAEKLAVRVVKDLGPQIKLYWMEEARK